MTRTGRNQTGEPMSAIHPGRRKGVEELRRGQWRLHRFVPAVRTQPIGERAEPVPDRPGRRLRRVSFRGQQLVSRRDDRRPRDAEGSRTRSGSAHSVGRWDGDTLVIETRGFNGWTRLDTIGHPHSDQLHLTQTFRRMDADHIAYTRHGRRSDHLHAAVEERARADAAKRRSHRVLVRREQQRSSRRAHQGLGASDGETLSQSRGEASA